MLPFGFDALREVYEETKVLNLLPAP
jgi:hypothetical protein